MLHILFLLLKIIGGILLTILCLVVLVVLLVLFVPVRYRASAEKYSDFAAEAEVSWLLHLLGFFMRLDMKEEEGRRLHLRLRIACFTLYDNLHPREKRIKKKRVSKTKAKAPANETVPKEQTLSDSMRIPENNTDRRADGDIDRNADKSIDIDIDRNIDKNAGIDRKIENDKNVEDDNIDNTIYIEETNRDRNLFANLLERIQNILKKIADVCSRILHVPSAIARKIRHLSDTITRLLEKKNRLLAIYRDEKNHRWLMLFLRRLKKVLLRMLPKIDRFLWHFGFGDPATTGQVLGYLSVLYPVCRERMVLQPEFQQKVMEGEARLHGHFRMLPIVVLLVRSFLNRQFFSIVKQVKNI